MLITHDGLDANSVTVSITVHALLITKCEGKVLSLVSLDPRRFRLEAWWVLEEGYEGKVDIGQQRSWEVSSIHVPDGRRCTARDATLVACFLPWRKTLHSTELLQVQISSRRSKTKRHTTEMKEHPHSEEGTKCLNCSKI